MRRRSHKILWATKVDDAFQARLLWVHVDELTVHDHTNLRDVLS